MTTTPRVVIVGGGIGGFTFALSLARRGVGATLLERAPEIKEIGAGIQLGPNAGRILQRLGVMDAVMNTAVLPTRIAIHDIYTGRELHRATLGPEFQARFGAPYTLMHRADILDALYQQALATALVDVRTGKEVVGVHQDATSATVECADGSQYSGDVVVGADGLRSAVRRLTLDDSEPIASEYVIYRGPGPKPEGTEDAVVLYTGVEMHIMQYPIHGGELLNRVLSFRSRRGPVGSKTWATREELFERFDGVCDEVKAHLGTLDLETKWVQFDRKPMPGWSKGRITLLGDAAHPMRQYLAQGAGQAMEDGAHLASLLASGADIETVLKQYEADRYPHTSAVQRGTRFLGELWHVGGVGAIARDAYLGSMSETDYGVADWLWAENGPPAPPAPSTFDLYELS